MISMAPGEPRSPYRWSEAVRVQLTERELVAFAAALIGACPGARGEAHGETNDKGFAVSERQGKLILRTWATGRHYAVALGAEDRFALAALALRQLRERAPWLSPSDLALLLQLTMGPVAAVTPAL